MLDPTTLDNLFKLRRRGIKVGLHRTEALLERCANPHYKVPVIHVAGTNGKGSTSAMIASILCQEERKVGLYTSPHLVNFNERIRINGVPISDDGIVSFLDRYLPDINALESTFFETATALTFSYFCHEKVDIAVIEVGLGGRLDSTNIAKSILSVITPIHFDHMEFLGYDLPSITREKCGILKENTPIVSANQLPEAAEIIEAEATNRGVPLIIASNEEVVKNITLDDKGTSFTYDDNNIRMPLVGNHQVTNAQTAIAAVNTLFPKIETENILRGIETVNWPGRLQKLQDDPPLFYDVAHNAHGLEATLTTLMELFPNHEINTVCALKKTKGLASVAGLINRHCRKVITTSPEEEDFWTANNLAAEFHKYGISAVPEHSVLEALTHIKSTSRNYIWLIFGSHFIAGEVYNKFGFPFDNGII